MDSVSVAAITISILLFAIPIAVCVSLGKKVDAVVETGVITEGGMSRAPFFLVLFGTHVLSEVLVGGIGGDAWIVVWILSVAVAVWATSERCVELGIDKIYAWWILVPLVPLWFMFKRGGKYYENQASKNASVS